MKYIYFTFIAFKEKGWPTDLHQWYWVFAGQPTNPIKNGAGWHTKPK